MNFCEICQGADKTEDHQNGSPPFRLSICTLVFFLNFSTHGFRIERYNGFSYRKRIILEQINLELHIHKIALRIKAEICEIEIRIVIMIHKFPVDPEHNALALLIFYGIHIRDVGLDPIEGCQFRSPYI